MNNPECTPLSQAEELALMKAFPSWLSDQDEAIARRIFEQLVFFWTIGRNTRRCVCTSCMEGFLVDKAIRPEFFKTKHGQACECPKHTVMKPTHILSLRLMERGPFFIFRTEKRIPLIDRILTLLSESGELTENGTPPSTCPARPHGFFCE